MINSKIIIGLTGNIATGKSVIRRMLSNSSALGIDADELAHRMLYPGGSAYEPVIKTFGPQILEQDQSISRQKLGEIVFNDPEKLTRLEAFIHPGVISSILTRIQHSKAGIVVIEAIKLIESGLMDICDRLWVSNASPQTRVDRLMEHRGFTEDEASARVLSQSPQSEKCQQADVVINTESTFKDTWQQVQIALNDTIQLKKESSEEHINISEGWFAQPSSNIPLEMLENFWFDQTGMLPAKVYEFLGKNMVLPLLKDNHLSAMLLWDNWNFTARLTRVLPLSILAEYPQMILRAFEYHSLTKQCELLLFSESLEHVLASAFKKYDVHRQPAENLTYPAWKSAARGSARDQSASVWAKILMQPLEQKSMLQEAINKNV